MCLLGERQASLIMASRPGLSGLSHFLVLSYCCQYQPNTLTGTDRMEIVTTELLSLVFTIVFTMKKSVTTVFTSRSQI